MRPGSFCVRFFSEAGAYPTPFSTVICTLSEPPFSRETRGRSGLRTSMSELTLRSFAVSMAGPFPSRVITSASLWYLRRASWRRLRPISIADSTAPFMVEDSPERVPKRHAVSRRERRDGEQEMVFITLCAATRRGRHRDLWRTDFLLNDVHGFERERGEEGEEKTRKRGLTGIEFDNLLDVETLFKVFRSGNRNDFDAELTCVNP